MTDVNKSESIDSYPDASTNPPESATTAAIAEPFECPNCGQMLGPGSTVCAACRQTVDFTKVRAAAAEPPPVAPVSAQVEKPPIPFAGGKSQFSLPIFVAFVLAYLLILGAERSFLTATQAFYFQLGLLVGCTAWVIYDAHIRRVPHPLRWGLGTLFIWLVVFPWYISRRRTPEVPCPIMDAQSRFFVRTVLFVFVLCVILSFLFFGVLHKPPR